WLQTIFCAWFTIGFFVDAYAHHNNVPESFFSPWHGLLYAGYLVTSGHLVWAGLRGRKQGRSWSTALPVGYNGSLLGSLAFGAGGLGDMVWHIV
ncbi:MAG: hypothetical protein GWN87_27180, partial [Desulfuromonadales bacterium]|nr:hypothetical protein [Desulfuromonadales bacterium]NIS43408.1 hypothetical protein [Desulfuromonadales bacterium]